jgi:OmpA-OmpF porin, OOP family
LYFQQGNFMNFKVKALLAVVAVSASSLASAQWYVGGSVGVSNTSLNESSLRLTGVATQALSKNESDTGTKAWVGYQLNKNFAIEGGYVNLGQFSASNTYTGPNGTLTAKIKTDGWNLAVLGMLPLGSNMSMFAKLGAYMSTTSGTSSGTGTLPPGAIASVSNSETNVMYGFGLDYNLSKSWVVRGELESFQDLRPSSTANKGNVSLYSLGVNYKF